MSASARTKLNLEQKRKQAKALLKSVNRLDGKAAARFTWNHPRFRGMSPQEVIREGVQLSEAQHVIASESGFASWPKLVEYVRLLETEPNGPVAAFEEAVRAIIRGDAQQLKLLLRQHPDVATMRSARHHRCVLLHYIAANGVENEHQIVPPNAVEIANILFAAGADAVVDATTDAYGGGPGSTPLVALVTSGHPHEAGVQDKLVEVFCRAGANPNGIDNDGMPLSMALGFRYPKAAQTLVSGGAVIGNLPAAAGMGQMDLVKDFLDAEHKQVSKKCVFPNPGFEEFPESQVPHPDRTMQQALVFACMCGHLEIAELLLAEGVDINGGPRRGITPIHEASYQGQGEVVHWLIQNGADPTIRDEMWNSTAIGWADEGNHKGLVEWLFSLDRVDFLDAVALRRYELVRMILEVSPEEADAPNGQGAALRHAAVKGDARMAQLLIDFGANPRLANENGHSAFDYAEKNGNEEMKRVLNSGVEEAGE